MLTRDAVVKASLELGQESGEEALTMRALASKLGVSATSLYGIFDGKEAILRELRAGAWNGLADALTPALQITRRRDRLRQMCMAYLEFARSNPWLYSLTMESPLLFEESVSESQATRALGPIKIALAALREGAPSETDEAELQLQTIDMWASLHGIASLQASGHMSATLRGSDTSDEAFATSYVDALVDTLAPEPPLSVL